MVPGVADKENLASVYDVVSENNNYGSINYRETIVDSFLCVSQKVNAAIRKYDECHRLEQL